MDWYRGQSRFTDPGAQSSWLDGVPRDLAPDLDVPFLRGLPYARHTLVLDLAALTKPEMILWDLWGDLDDAPVLAPDAVARADELAEVMADADLEQPRVLSEAEDLRVPPVIRSVTPPGPLPVEVVLR
ncbi:hypothetical protein ABZ342_06465 [Amycolatopsis sp. NPDC005961]|uniref:hypothetical protein n=1 Tax=Amycolatopsis sp. NPDC005961 TaxID=3156720 RepID=UPI0033CA1B2E